MSDRGGRHRRICSACGSRFYVIGKKLDALDRCGACVQNGVLPRKPIQEVVQEVQPEPVKPIEPPAVLTDYNGREVSADALKIRLMRGW